MAAYASVAVLLLAGWAALNPAPMAWVYIAVVIAFEVWLARRMINLGRNPVSAREAPYHFSEDEAQLVGRYRFYFTYPALARQSASVLAAIGLTALVLAFWLLYKQAFVQAVKSAVAHQQCVIAGAQLLAQAGEQPLQIMGDVHLAAERSKSAGRVPAQVRWRIQPDTVGAAQGFRQRVPMGAHAHGVRARFEHRDDPGGTDAAAQHGAAVPVD